MRYLCSHMPINPRRSLSIYLLSPIHSSPDSSCPTGSARVHAGLYEPPKGHKAKSNENPHDDTVPPLLRRDLANQRI